MYPLLANEIVIHY